MGGLSAMHDCGHYYGPVDLYSGICYDGYTYELAVWPAGCRAEFQLLVMMMVVLYSKLLTLYHWMIGANDRGIWVTLWGGHLL